MKERETDPKVFTLAEANSLLPQVRQLLVELRAMMERIIAKETAIDVEELAGGQSDGALSPAAKQRMAQLMQELDGQVEAFQAALKIFNELGCHLKDLDQGLVDFYSMRNDELIVLCWREGEERVQFWHRLEDGYSGRQPLH